MVLGIMGIFKESLLKSEHFASATWMIRDSLIWKLTANIVNACAKSCLYPVLLPQTYNAPVCSSLPFSFFTLNLFSIHSPLTFSTYCLCTSPWLCPFLSIYFPLHLSLSIYFLSVFISDPWKVFQFISSLLWLTLPAPPSLFLTLYLPFWMPILFQILSLTVISSSRFPPLIVSKTFLLDVDCSTRDLQLASSVMKVSHMNLT